MSELRWPCGTCGRIVIAEDHADLGAKMGNHVSRSRRRKHRESTNWVCGRCKGAFPAECSEVEAHVKGCWVMQALAR